MSKRSLAATVLLALLYWAFAGQVSLAETVTMFISLAAAIALAVSVHRVAERRFEARAPWVRLVLRTSTSIVKDSYGVGMFLARSLIRRPSCPAGSMIRPPFHVGTETARDATRRALVTLSVSASPDRYVIDVDRDGLLLAHALVGAPAETDPEWPI